jgi:uncharacterized membrane protein YagU involved in acid resistance
MQETTIDTNKLEELREHLESNKRRLRDIRLSIKWLYGLIVVNIVFGVMFAITSHGWNKVALPVVFGLGVVMNAHSIKMNRTRIRLISELIDLQEKTVEAMHRVGQFVALSQYMTALSKHLNKGKEDDQ